MAGSAAIVLMASINIFLPFMHVSADDATTTATTATTTITDSGASATTTSPIIPVDSATTTPALVLGTTTIPAIATTTPAIDISTTTATTTLSLAPVVAAFVSPQDVSTSTPTTTPVTNTVTLNVRYQDSVVFSGTVLLPVATTTTLNDSTGTPHPISSDSALYLLSQAAASSTVFSLSDLDYYSSFGEFYVNCLDINATPAIASSTVHACADWQYAVNNSNPSEGSDQYIAAPNDDIYFYYGNQRQFSVSATSTDTVTPVTVTAQKYDYTNNTWVPLAGEVVGATQPDPSNPWSPLVVATSTTNANGTTTLLMTDAGVYDIGLSDDGYYPTVAVTVATSTATTTLPVGTSGGGGGGSTQSLFNVSQALSYLASKQNANGSFDGSLYTDWAAIALAAGPQSQSRSEITNYEQSAPNTAVSATDYERHAMALEALGINPYTGTSVNYIQGIVNDFDGTQIGDPSLVNDDIFAIFPLLKAGYTISDPIISKDIQFIISQQSGNGSWGSIDLTAAAIQALSQVQSLNGVSVAMGRAENYLKSSETGGGFGTSYATSWALQAIAALGQSPSQWQQGSVTPLSYLAGYQQTDGGVEVSTTPDDSRVWATSYAIPAALGESWPAMLSSFPKSTSSSGSSGSSSGTSGTTSTSTPAVVATSTVSTTNNDATSTLAVAPRSPVLPLFAGTPIKFAVKNFQHKNSVSKITAASTSSSTAAVKSSNQNSSSTTPLSNIAAAGASGQGIPFKDISIVGGISVVVAGAFYIYKMKYN